MEASAVPGRGLAPARAALSAFALRRHSDEQLVDLFRAGQDEAFRALHDRYRSRLHAFVRQLLRGRAAPDVEDAVQDTFERAHTALRFGPRPPEAVGVWLYRVARNRCIDELRRRPPTHADVLDVTRPPVADTSTLAERRADVARLFSDVGELPEQQRSALLMRELQGLSHNEVAGALDVTVSAAKALLVRARGGLAEAAAAREAACADIRIDLEDCHSRGVKLGAHARRHLSECGECRFYREQMRRRRRMLVPGFAPLGLLTRFLRRGARASASPAGGVAGGTTSGFALSSAGKLAMIIVAGVAGAGLAGGSLHRFDSALGSLFGGGAPPAAVGSPGANAGYAAGTGASAQSLPLSGGITGPIRLPSWLDQRGYAHGAPGGFTVPGTVVGDDGGRALGPSTDRVPAFDNRGPGAPGRGGSAGSGQLLPATQSVSAPAPSAPVGAAANGTSQALSGSVSAGSGAVTGATHTASGSAGGASSTAAGSVRGAVGAAQSAAGSVQAPSAPKAPTLPKAPTVNAPNVSAPSAPRINAPDIHTPGVPSTSTPSLNAPNVHTPGTPSTSVPNVNAGKVNAPNLPVAPPTAPTAPTLPTTPAAPTLPSVPSVSTPKLP
jgi:RNA polymerase sigma factor (sigma-70 family)